MNSYYVEYEDYTIYMNKSPYGVTASCIGHEEIVVPEIETIDVPKIKKGSYHLSILNGDDYGPQRFCSACGIKMIEKWDSVNDENVYEHPELESGEECIGEPVSGIVNRDELTMDELREVYRELNEKDREWRITNLEELRKIYVDHADDAGQSELEVHVTSYEDEDGNAIDPLENSEKGLADADSEIFELTNFSKEEISIISYIAGGNRSNFRYSAFNHKWYKTGGHGVLLYNQYTCLKKLYAAYAAGGIRKHVMEHLLWCVFACLGMKHPKAVRYTKYRNFKSWKNIERAVKLDLAVANQDWELEARRLEERIYM